MLGGPPCGVRESDSVVWAQSQGVIVGYSARQRGRGGLSERSDAWSLGAIRSHAMARIRGSWTPLGREISSLTGSEWPLTPVRFSIFASGRASRPLPEVVRDCLQSSRAGSGFTQRAMTTAMEPCPAGPGWSIGAKRRWVSGAGVKLVTRCWAGWRVGSDRHAWKGRSARCGRPCGRGDRGWPRRWSGR